MNNGEFWADKIMDLANLAGAVLIFGQLVAAKLNLVGLISGVIIYVGAVIVADNFLRR